MLFESTTVDGVLLITAERFDDQRGFFARSWGADEFEAHGLQPRMVQRNLSFNHQARTLRGMHYQQPPHTEVKLVSCLVGAIFDVAMDVRPESPTFGRWFGAELRPESGAMLYIPEGCAHGYVTLEPQTTVEYLISTYYAPGSAAGVRWDDPFFGVRWPVEPLVMNARDRSWSDFAPAAAGASRARRGP
jgi:dTDP-4-dehydrorhamnose 3,5-epimerase